MIEHFLLMNTVNPVQFYPKNPGLNQDPGSTNSSRIAPPVLLSLLVSDILQCDKQRSHILAVAHGTSSQLVLVPVNPR
jgi:hypothetical protein